MNKRLATITATLILTGCAAAQQKGQTLKETGEMFANPAQRCILYDRDQGSTTFFDAKCTGALCKHMPESCGQEAE